MRNFNFLRSIFLLSVSSFLNKQPENQKIYTSKKGCFPEHRNHQDQAISKQVNILIIEIPVENIAAQSE